MAFQPPPWLNAAQVSNWQSSCFHSWLPSSCTMWICCPQMTCSRSMPGHHPMVMRCTWLQCGRCLMAFRVLMGESVATFRWHQAQLWEGQGLLRVRVGSQNNLLFFLFSLILLHFRQLDFEVHDSFDSCSGSILTPASSAGCCLFAPMSSNGPMAILTTTGVGVWKMTSLDFAWLTMACDR